MSHADYAPTVQYYRIHGHLVAAAVLGDDDADVERLRTWAYELRDCGKTPEHFWISDLRDAHGTTYLSMRRSTQDCQITSGDALVFTGDDLRVMNAREFWSRAEVLA